MNHVRKDESTGKTDLFWIIRRYLDRIVDQEHEGCI
jgi:hypothetical protein